MYLLMHNKNLKLYLLILVNVLWTYMNINILIN